MTASATFFRSEQLRQAAHWGILGAFAYLLLIPVGHTPVLMVALLLMGVSSVFLVVADHRALVRDLRVPAILSAAVIVLGVVVGFGNEGWAHSLIAWAAAPVLFWTWAAALTEDLIRKLLWISMWATIALSAITLLIAFTIPTGFPESFLHPIFGGTRAASPSVLLSRSTGLAPSWRPRRCGSSGRCFPGRACCRTGGG